MIEANWLGAYVGRRVAAYALGVEWLQRIVSTGFLVEAGWQVLEGVPPGARLLAVVPHLDQRLVALIFEHADFAVVQEHAPVYPIRQVSCKTLDGAPERL